ncbi:MAG: ribonuclease HI [Candidatus Sericytochromatia bacterium]|nr:ribonuclease HI [Candidatus Sericytochromatia bacterium]
MKKITIYTDGSSLGNPGAGGYCAIISYGEHEVVVKGSEKNTTNNRMELLAVIEGVRALKEPCEIAVISDSTYVVKGINEWISNWIKKSFRDVKNPDLWKMYLEVSKNHKVKCTWVKAHAGHHFNERCDQLAKSEAEKVKALV